MTNRILFRIVKTQQPLVAATDEPVREVCRLMSERDAGSVLVVDKADGRLRGIFTGRDAVKLLAKGGDVGSIAVGKAMTRDPVTLLPTSRASEALRAMCEGGFRHVPVVSDGQIHGVVSRSDFKGMELEEFICMNTGLVAGSLEHRPLAEVIQRHQPPVHALEETVQDACRSMTTRKCGAALVTDKRQHVKGIFTGRDAMRMLATAKAPATVKLSKAMSRDPRTTTVDCNAMDALRAMSEGGFRHLPVVDGAGKLVGIVTKADFTGVELDRLEEEEHLKECIW
jgi:CBS domain-containing protein